MKPRRLVTARLLQSWKKVQGSLIDTLKGTSGTLTRSQLEKAKQGQALADKVWLTASGYDFGRNQQQQADVDLLAAFSRLPATTLQQNLATVEAINLNATSGLRQQALVDAEGRIISFSSPMRSGHALVRHLSALIVKVS